MDTPLTIVIFGASGDLTARKLVPALYRLFEKGRLPADSQVVGVARSPLTDEQFRDRLAAALREAGSSEGQTPAWAEFARRLHYVRGDAARSGGLEDLQAWLRQREPGGVGRRLYYLSVSPDLYPDIATRLGEAGMSRDVSTNHGDGWRRLIIEKPFGRDRESAQALNRVLLRHFQEDQLYRIDHYLGKETVQNLLVFRFANTIFEPLWNGRFIDHMQLTVSESVLVGSRGSYYDTAGVLRDMFQSHLLQVLTLLTMEAPARFGAEPLRNEKIKVLDAIPIYTPSQAARNVCCGQYQGYRSEKGVAADSRTPTFAAVRLEINNWRWQGVPFYLRSGKGLSARYSEAIVQFRCPPHLMFELPEGATLPCNRLSVCIQPDEGIHLSFQSKVPDQAGMVLRPADMHFHYRDLYTGGSLPEAYERLLQDAINGDATLFMRSDEIERAWAIMDPIIAATEQPSAPPPEEYPVGSHGPRSADELLIRDGRRWQMSCHH
jgi:glucose-6-phosphate 1-dehydrogenase